MISGSGGCGKSPSVWVCTTWRTWAAARRDDAAPKAGFPARLHFTLPEMLARVRRSCRKLCMSGSCRPPLTIRYEVHPGLIWQDAVRFRPSSRERTWPVSFLGWRIASGLCRSQSRLDGKMGVKRPKREAKWRLLQEHATLPIMAQLLYCHVVALIVFKRSAERQIATTIYLLRTCVETWFPKISKKPKQVAFRSISRMQGGTNSGSLQEVHRRDCTLWKPARRQARPTQVEWPRPISKAAVPGSRHFLG